MKNILYIALLCILAGCYTDRKASRQVSKAIVEKPTIAANLLRKSFPCITKPLDTTINYIDSVFMIDCPPDTVELVSVINFKDTIYKEKTSYKTVKVPVNVKIPTYIITRDVKDSADNVVLSGQIESLNVAKAKVEGKLSTITKLFISFLILFILSLVGNVLQFKKIL